MDRRCTRWHRLNAPAARVHNEVAEVRVTARPAAREVPVRSSRGRLASPARLIQHRPNSRAAQVPAIMTRHRVGLWLVGAFGGVGTTITLGLAAMARGLADRTGLVTELPLFDGAAAAGARRLRDRRPRHPRRRRSPNRPRNSGGTRGSSRPTGSPPAATSWPRPPRGSGPAPISAPAARSPAWDTGATPSPPRTAGQAVDRIAADMAAFVDAEVGRPHDRPQRRQHRTAVSARRGPPDTGTRSNAALADGGPELLPASSLYAAGRDSVRLYLHQLHAQPGCLDARPRRAGRSRRARSTPARTARPARP